MIDLEYTALQPQLAESIQQEYLDEIKRATGEDATKYRHYFIAGSEGTYDVTNDGDVSCAWFVSNVLWKHSMIERAHPTVASTVKDMVESGWQEIEYTEAAPGSVVRWPVGKSGNEHLGFYIGDDRYISNNYLLRSPAIHSETLLDKRTPESFYALESLRINLQARQLVAQSEDELVS